MLTDKQLRTNKIKSVLEFIQEAPFKINRNESLVEVQCYFSDRHGFDSKNELRVDKSYRSNTSETSIFHFCDACLSIIEYKLNGKKEPIRLQFEGMEHFFLIKQCGVFELYQNSSEYDSRAHEFILVSVAQDNDSFYLSKEDVGHLKEVLKEDDF